MTREFAIFILQLDIHYDIVKDTRKKKTTPGSMVMKSFLLIQYRSGIGSSAMLWYREHTKQNEIVSVYYSILILRLRQQKK